MQREISLADVVRVKKAARAAKLTNPGLSHKRLMNDAAVSMYGVRNLHEFEQLRKQTVDAQVQKPDYSACPLCRHPFVGKNPAGLESHREHHERYEEARDMLGYLPAGLDEREAMKRLGRDWLRGIDIEVRRAGAFVVLAAKFDGSLDTAIMAGRAKYHPDFDGYLPFVLQAGPDDVPLDLRQSLLVGLGLREPIGAMRLGSTDWPPRGLEAPPKVKSAPGQSLREKVMALAKDQGAVGGAAGTVDTAAFRALYAVASDWEVDEMPQWTLAPEAQELANALRTLHLGLETAGTLNSVWSAARNLEDVVGSGQYRADDLERARDLLRNHGA